MKLVWKLLRQHISVPQIVGFFFANLFGMMIILTAYQFYRDILPVFTGEDSFMKADYLIVNKKIGAATTISGRSDTFSQSEIDNFKHQSFVKNIGSFTSTSYKVDAQIGISGKQLLNSEFFFESVPDHFVDVDPGLWHFSVGQKEIPIILPQAYLTMYNFGFAQNHSMPKISDGLIGMIDMTVFIRGNGHEEEFKGKVIGFSNRLNTILVPQSFMNWSNSYFSTEGNQPSNRLIVDVSNPSDEGVTKYIESKNYEVDADKLEVEKTAYFLRLLVSIVLTVGLLITALSFYILMLSIYLLVEKNTDKLKNLLLIGYSTSGISLPYKLLTVSLNALVLILAYIVLVVFRSYYMGILEALFPNIDDGSIIPSILLGLVLFISVSLLNSLAINRKIRKIW
jgi:hypothetical protein